MQRHTDALPARFQAGTVEVVDMYFGNVPDVCRAYLGTWPGASVMPKAYSIDIDISPACGQPSFLL